MTQQDDSSHFTFTGLVNVNITDTGDTPNPYFPVKSNYRPHNGADCMHAPVPPIERRNAGVTSLTPTSVIGLATTSVVPIQIIAPPLSKIGWDATNNPPIPCTDRDVQGRSLLRQGPQLDSHYTNEPAPQISNKL